MTPSGSARDRFAQLFEDPAQARRRGWRGRRGRIAAAVVGALLLSAVVASEAFGSSGPSYRTATASAERVDAVLHGVATIEPVSQATVAFPVPGTVGTVAVLQGQIVSAGQVLATLDPQSLQQALHQKQAALAQAQLTLSKALSGQSTGGVGPSSGFGGSGSTGSASTGTATATALTTRDGTAPPIVFTDATPSDPELAADAKAVVDAQAAVDTALTKADDALAAAGTVCAGGGSPSPTTTTTTTTPPTPDPSTACATALQTALDVQKALATAQQKLVDASKALDDLLEQRAATPAPTAPPAASPPAAGPTSGGITGGSSGGSSGTSGGSVAGRGGSSSSSSSSPSAADLAADQKAVDAAAAAVAVAQQSVDQATITTPIDGTVVAVNLATGESVTAASTTANVIVQGAGGFEATTSIGIDDIPRIAVGQAATVVPDGSHTPLTAKVVSIGVAPDPNSSTATTRYLVFLGLTDPNADLNNGSTASVAIVTKQTKAAVAVPTSAVTTNGTRHTVRVLDGDTAHARTVQIGAVGSTWTEITSGLSAGDQVVLADLSAPLPSSATSGANGAQNQTGTGAVFPNGVRVGLLPDATTRRG